MKLDQKLEKGQRLKWADLCEAKAVKDFFDFGFATILLKPRDFHELYILLYL